MTPASASDTITVRLTHSGLTSEESRASYRVWPQILGWLNDYVEQL